MTGPVTLTEIGNELKPYPGRDWMVLRIVLAVLLATILVMTFQIPSGWLSLYFCFVFAKPTTKQTVLVCLAVAIVAIPIIPLSLVLLKFAVEPNWLRMLMLVAVLWGTFFLANIMTEGDVVRNLAILFVTVLTFPDVYSQPYMWEEATIWLIPMVYAGVLPLILVTLLIRPEHVLPKGEGGQSIAKYGFLADRWSNPEHKVYALKCTFASMATYIIYTALNFQEIQTALMTCLILALPTTEGIIHKTRLRIVGATIGAAMAMFAAIWLIPLSNSLWLLFAVIGGGSAIAAWVALSSPRISYAGRQMALAQFMLVTHSFGPSTDLSVLRDRLLGILLGNIMMGVTFKYLWPQKGGAATAVQKSLSLVLVGLLALLVVGCQNIEELAPKSPSRPWRSAIADDYRLPQQYAAYAPPSAAFDPEREYTLSELADLALRSNPGTRVAWEQARAVAAGVGVAQSVYYPQLSLLVAAGYEHISSPLPKNIFNDGYFHADVAMIRPAVQLDWLLWDFGRSEATVKRAREQAVAQNFAFNEYHQQLLFDVCRSYYKLISTRSALAVAESALEDAQLVEKSTRSSLEHGFATQAELLQAQQYVAQCSFNVSALKADLRKAQVTLSECVGLNPGQPLRVQDIAELPLPEGLEQSAQALVESALEHRPDLRAQVAQLRAAEASLDEVEAQWWPELVLTGNAGPAFTAFSVEDSSWDTTHNAQYGIGIGLKVPIFEGFRRQQLSLAAQAQKRQAEASIEQARNSAVRQVWEAFTDFENARSQLIAAEALVKASEASKEATLASFKQGFASVTDVQAQQTNLVQAKESYNQARTNVFLSAALLQLVTGQISAQSVQPGVR